MVNWSDNDTSVLPPVQEPPRVAGWRDSVTTGHKAGLALAAVLWLAAAAIAVYPDSGPSKTTPPAAVTITHTTAARPHRAQTRRPVVRPQPAPRRHRTTKPRPKRTATPTKTRTSMSPAPTRTASPEPTTPPSQPSTPSPVEETP